MITVFSGSNPGRRPASEAESQRDDCVRVPSILAEKIIVFAVEFDA
jgi:hypothetical protein